QFEVVPVRGGRLRIHHGLVREVHVLRGEGLAVVPLHVLAELEGEGEAVLAELPRLRYRGNPVQVLVGLDQPVVDEAAHGVGGAICGDVRNEAGNVTNGGLHEGVAEGGLVARRGLVGGHCHMMPAAVDAEEYGQREERDPGAAGREETPATHVTSSPGQAEREWQERRREEPARRATKRRVRWAA